MGKHADSIDRAIIERIRRQPSQVVVCPGDFLDLGSRAAVDQALSRNVRAGVLRRVARGLYDLPRPHPRFGPFPPSVEEFLSALARRDGVRIRWGGARAAHALGLTDQVPMKEVYLTNGRTRTLVLGNLPIQFKHASPRLMGIPGDASYHVIQGLRWIGQPHVHLRMILHLCRVLSDDHKAQLRRDAGYAPVWMLDCVRRIAKSPSRGASTRNGLPPAAQTSTIANPRGSGRRQRRGRGGGEGLHDPGRRS